MCGFRAPCFSCIVSLRSSRVRCIFRRICGSDPRLLDAPRRSCSYQLTDFACSQLCFCSPALLDRLLTCQFGCGYTAGLNVNHAGSVRIRVTCRCGNVCVAAPLTDGAPQASFVAGPQGLDKPKVERAQASLPAGVDHCATGQKFKVCTL